MYGCLCWPDFRSKAGGETTDASVTGAENLLAQFAYSFSPLVEETMPDTVVLDVSGSELLYGAPEELAETILAHALKPKKFGGLGSEIYVAVALNPDAAIHAARSLELLKSQRVRRQVEYQNAEVPSERSVTRDAEAERQPVGAEAAFEQRSDTSNAKVPSERESITSSAKGSSEGQSVTSNATLTVERQSVTSSSHLPIVVIPPGLEGRCLGDLPITRLIPSLAGVEEERAEEIFETLELWGIRRFSDFARLPVTGVAQRLGQEGVRLQSLARGATKRHLVLPKPEPEFKSYLELGYPISETEPLSFILARLLNQLCSKLNSYGLATNELNISLGLEDGRAHDRTLSLPHPMRNQKIFMRLLLLDIEMNPPSSAVISVAIECEPVKPRVIQHGLFVPLAPEPEKLELTLARISKLVGPANVGSAELLDTHRPEAFKLKRFFVRREEKKRRATAVRKRDSLRAATSRRLRAPLLGFRVFRPPVPAKVVVERKNGAKPLAILGCSSPTRSVYGDIVRASGPWRASGEWWKDGWARNKWDVALKMRASGSEDRQLVCRIFQDLQTGSWFIEGVYD